MKHLYIRVPDELHARVKSTAAEKGVSMNHLVVNAIGVWMDSIQVLGLIEKFDGETGEVVFNIPPFELKKLERMLGKENPIWEPEWFVEGEVDEQET